MKKTTALFSFLLLFAACGPQSPIAGNWSQETEGEQKGMSLTFDGGSDKLVVHTAPRTDGTHDHVDATYTFDAATKAVTVKGKLMGDGKADTWTGTLDGEHLELGAADTKLRFHKGGDPHKH